jgi:MshEN domain
MPRPSLEDLLIEERLVDERTLRLLRRAARKSGVSLARALVDDGRLDDETLAQLVTRRLTLARVDLEREPVDEDAIREVPFDLVDGRRLLPLTIERRGARRVMRVAMADPLDRDAVEEIELSTGCDVEPVVARVGELAVAAQRYYRGMITKAIPRTRAPGGPTTQPRHQVADEAPLDARLAALVELLVDRGVIERDALHDAIRRLLKKEAGE